MALRVLGILASPRRLGNSDRLLREALKGAASAGGGTEDLALADCAIAPCAECNACARTGVCRQHDGYAAVLDRILAADRLIFATPVFFMGVPAQAKLLIDRCQCLWAAKFLLKKPLYAQGPRDRRALVIAVGGSRGVRMFESIRLTMKYWLDALEVAYAANLFVNQVDDAGDIQKHPEALAAARELGRDLVADTGPPPRQSRDVMISEAVAAPARRGTLHGE